jgi:hypothetical protein
MKYISIEERRFGTIPGTYLDPTAYVAHLAELQGELPPGAWKFATDPEHYDFYSRHCIKDLKLSSIAMARTSQKEFITISFAPSKFKHEQALTVAYSGVASFKIEMTSGRCLEYESDGTGLDWSQLSDVLLDEILPVGQGCSHEVALVGGSIFVVSQDLSASWN